MYFKAHRLWMHLTQIKVTDFLLGNSPTLLESHFSDLQNEDFYLKGLSVYQHAICLGQHLTVGVKQVSVSLFMPHLNLSCCSESSFSFISFDLKVASCYQVPGLLRSQAQDQLLLIIPDLITSFPLTFVGFHFLYLCSAMWLAFPQAFSTFLTFLVGCRTSIECQRMADGQGVLR